MRGAFPLRLARLLSVSAVLAGCGSAGLAQTSAPEAYRKWLEEDVAYLVTAVERDVFLKLATDRERDLFIAAFWNHRAGKAGGEGAAVRAEHYRRITHANRVFGRDAAAPGWKTDRGRIYILLGPPTEQRSYDSRQGLRPVEVWFYQGQEARGLPKGFSLVFFQPDGFGEYELYSPVKDGPKALLTAYAGDPVDPWPAYRALREIAPELAPTSLSLIEGESGAGPGGTSLASDLLLRKVEESGRAGTDDAYARKYLEYRGLVDVEYSANYIGCRAAAAIAREPGGLYLVHYAIEPERLSLAASGGRLTARILIDGTVRTPDGRTIHQFEKIADISLDEAAGEALASTPFVLQDLFPLLPGTYELRLLARNEASKEFTSFETALLVPGSETALQMTAPILAFRTAPAPDSDPRLKPFRLAGRDLFVQPRRVFSAAETLTVAFQVFGAGPGATIRTVVSRDGSPVFRTEDAAAAAGTSGTVLKDIPLAGFAPAHYVLETAVVMAGQTLISAREEFDVAHQPKLRRPWFYTKTIPPASDPWFQATLGAQAFNAGRLAEAKALLEAALAADTGSEDAALALARVYGAMKEDARIPEILAPFLAPSRTPRYESHLLAGQARLKAGEFEAGLRLFERMRTEFGVTAPLLNDIAECLAGLKRFPEALAAWEQSLRLNPNQPAVRDKTAAIKDHKPWL